MSASAASPLVSVIIPCHNHGGYLAEAIESILAQTHRCTEIIVVDDGSSDNTWEVARSYGQRVRGIRTENRGSSAARNTGLDTASGQWVQFLDADDVLLPEKIERCLQAVPRHSNPGVSYCDYYRSGPDPSLALPEPRISPEMDCCRARHELAQRWEDTLCIPLHCFLFQRSLLEKPPVRFDPVLRDHEDWDFAMRALLRAAHVTYVSEALAVYRRHSGAKCRVYADEQGSGFVKAIRKQIRLNNHDAELSAILRCKLRTVQMRYGLLPPSVRLAKAFEHGVRRMLNLGRRLLSG